ncbi:haloacid dehalogenase type II [Halobacillus sp. Marseille-Q1614]|uniref:haloacid dehalogenase type II n=1 Tax=Halobacillus sp. Marseille-Q1614 TaxID=2709134 RepID=UPI00156E000E|nr:haloacid dehalogenase type II [Halobacillus sp. Marseille-Q1614]
MKYKAYLFDAYGTLFDVHSVKERLEDHYPDKAGQISQDWRQKQVHYFMIRQLVDDYVPFDQITLWSLQDALAENEVSASSSVIEELMEQYKKLTPYEEVLKMKAVNEDKELMIFSNGTLSMLEPLLENNYLTSSFSIMSADEPKVYKPQAEAYEYAKKQVNADKEEILFFSSNPWDIAGAASYGFHTAWVNRSKTEWPRIGIAPSYIIENLTKLPQ